MNKTSLSLRKATCLQPILQLSLFQRDGIAYLSIALPEPSQKNDKVQKLEDECDWYRKEALRLDSFNTAMKKDLKYMKGKLEVLGTCELFIARSWRAGGRAIPVVLIFG